MATAERIRGYLEESCEPLTLEEVHKEVPCSSQHETEAALEKLVKDGNITSRDIHTTEGRIIRLYWRHKSKNSIPVPTTTPRSILPPTKRSRLPFKSPARTMKISQSPSLTPLSSRRLRSRLSREGDSVEDLAGEVHMLREKLAGLVKEVEELDEFKDCGGEDELQMHIDKLHEYNEIKDVGQLLLGKIAEVEGSTTAALYERFGLQLDN